MSPAKKRKKKKINIVDLIIKILIAACVIVGIALTGLLVSEMLSSGEEDTDDTGTVPQINTTHQSIGEPETTEAETTEAVTTEPETTQDVTNITKEDFELPVSTTSATLWAEEDRIIINPEQELWSLVVVNGTRAMPEGYEPQLANVAGTDVKMDYRVAPYYTAMYEAAKNDGITLTPYSGYRSYDRQKRNYNNLTEKYMSQYNLSREDAAIKAATVILPPGTSEHNLGLAMDVCNTYDSFANQKEYAWLVEHAHEYGFILRYTAEKQPITGIVPEPWHWRFVGVEYAEDIKNSGLCLEEWLASKGIAY